MARQDLATMAMLRFPTRKIKVCRVHLEYNSLRITMAPSCRWLWEQHVQQAGCCGAGETTLAAQSHSRSQGLPQPFRLSLSRRLQWASNQVYLLRCGLDAAMQRQLFIGAKWRDHRLMLGTAGKSQSLADTCCNTSVIHVPCNTLLMGLCPATLMHTAKQT